MTWRGWMARIPIWMRVPGIIALVLAGVLISTMLLTAMRGGGHGGAGDHTRTSGTGHTGASHGSGGDGGHGAGHTTVTTGR